MKCKICNYSFKNKNINVLMKSIYIHLSKKHKFNLLQRIEYIQNNLNQCSIINRDFLYDLYWNKELNLNEISDYINNNFDIKILFKAINKSVLRKLFKIYNIKQRTISEFGKLKFKNKNVWNKGLTKNDHPSIMKYANSRMGKDNPMYSKGYILKNSAKFQLSCKNIEKRKKISETLKYLWKIGKIQPFYKQKGYNTWKDWFNSLDEIKQEILKEKQIKAGHMTVIKQGRRNPSAIEALVKNILNKNYIDYTNQFYIFTNKKRYVCDFYLPKYNLIIEVNGDYWHMNPEKYDYNTYNKAKKLTAQQIWENDSERIINISKKYNIEVLWELDIKNNNLQLIIENIIKKYESNQS